VTTLRAGLSGGGAGGLEAATALRAAADVDLVAVHDPDPVALQTLQSAATVGFGTTRYEALLASGVDFVVLAGPPAARLAQVQLAAEQAVPVLLLPPMAASLAAAEAMVAASEAAATKLGVAVAGMADPVLDQVRRMLAEGWSGGLVAVHVFCGDDQLRRRPGPAAPRPPAFADDPLLGLLAADLHLLPWLCSRPLRRVAAQATAGLLPLPHDRLAATAELAGAALATLTATHCSQGRSLSVHGTDGGVLVTDDLCVVRGERAFRGDWFDYDSPGVVQQVPRAHPAASGGVYDCFARWLDDRDGFPCPADQALQDLRALEAVHRALATGRTEMV
jgi:predicted dehydrogenase